MTEDKAILLFLTILNEVLVDGGVENLRGICRSEAHSLVGVYNNTQHDMLTCARMCLGSEVCNYFATRRQTSGQPDDCVLGFAIEPCGWYTSQSASAKWTTYRKSGFLKVCNCSADMIPFGKSCHIFPSGKFTWDQGNAQCASINAKMVEIEDMAANAFIVLEGKKRGYSNVWLGGSDSAVEGTWVWTSGAEVGLNNWHPGEPNNAGGIEDFMEMFLGNSKWNDAPKTVLKPIVCEVSCL